MGEPRIRVSALLGWRGQILLCRHEKPGKEYWLLPGGGVDAGESLTDALYRELAEELGIDEDVPVEGPVCIVDSIAPKRTLSTKHVVHIIFASPTSELFGCRSRAPCRVVSGRDARSRWLRVEGELEEGREMHRPLHALSKTAVRREESTVPSLRRCDLL